MQRVNVAIRNVKDVCLVPPACRDLHLDWGDVPLTCINHILLKVVQHNYLMMIKELLVIVWLIMQVM